jgi:RHS repeat-associated protein
MGSDTILPYLRNNVVSAVALANTYDAKNRLTKTQIGATATDTVTYKINAMGQRVQKIGAGLYAPNTLTTIDAATGNSPLSRSIAFNARFAYDEQGRLIGEYAGDGRLIAETIWFNDLPIATLRPKGANAGTPLGITGTTTGNPANGATAANANNIGTNTTTNRVNVEIFYIHPDHLGTPRVVTRSTIATGANAPSSATSTSPGAINKATWRRESDPFGTLLGNSAPNENPQIITGTATQVQAATFIYDEMFPGQHRDRESGKFYNYFRDYDPSKGGYTTSDPIGLNGGLSTYGYALQSPLRYADRLGLDPWWTDPILNPPQGGVYRCRANLGDEDTPPAWNKPSHRYSCVHLNGRMICSGIVPDGPFSSELFNEKFSPNVCKYIGKDECYANCLKEQWAQPTPPWILGTCHAYDIGVNKICEERCIRNRRK